MYYHSYGCDSYLIAAMVEEIPFFFFCFGGIAGSAFALFG
jgi:hypothetical protein